MIDTSDRIERSTRLRIMAVGIGLSLLFVVVIGRAVHLHFSKHGGKLGSIASQQYQAVIPTAPRRGKILDAKERELAVSVPVESIFADPSAVPDPKATLDAIEQIYSLGKERRKIERRMRSGKKFAWIKRRLPSDVAAQIKALRLPGIHFVEESLRVYPNGELASQLLGAVGFDAKPLAGLELAYDSYLRSKKERATYQRDARGRVYFSPVAFEAQDDVGTMRLTIDKIIQYSTEKALGRAMEKAQARGAMAVVVDVDTGKVLAMTNRPTFDPNEYNRYSQETWRNRAVTDAYEPGSTFKVLIAAAALESGLSPEQKYDCERGAIRIGSTTLHDHDPYDILSIADIIKVSSNIGTYKIARELGRERVSHFTEAFGIGKKLAIDFPGEVPGTIRSMKHWRPVEFATMAFGQGVSVTPLQMTMLFAAVANGGRLMKPYLVEQIVGRDNELLYAAQPSMIRTVISPKTAAAVRAMLERVVQEGGTGTLAASSLYRTAGKTGTAQKVAEGYKGYAKGKYFASFIGIAPVEKPRIAVFVGIDEPKGSYYGGTVAGPVFREIVESTLQYLEIPASTAPIILTHKTQEKRARPSAVPAIDKGNLPAFVRVGKQQIVVPDLAGLSMRQVVRLASELDVPLKVRGAGVVVAQRPRAGGKMEEGEPVQLEFALPK